MGVCMCVLGGGGWGCMCVSGGLGGCVYVCMCVYVYVCMCVYVEYVCV